MSAAYTFGVIRYVHDVVSQEFANVGVVVCAPSAQFLKARCSTRYARLSAFFEGLDGPTLRSSLQRFQSSLDRKGRKANWLLESSGNALVNIVGEVLPKDDSSLQFSPVGAGLAEDLEAALDEVFKRHVTRYADKPEKKSRTDEEVLPTFKEALAKVEVPSLSAKTIETPVYTHHFPLAWKNGVWNACEAVSFDLVKKGSIIEKANTWLGRLFTLSKSSEQFQVHLLLGVPSSPILRTAYKNAVSILKSSPTNPKLHSENSAAEFAEIVKKELTGSSSDESPSPRISAWGADRGVPRKAAKTQRTQS